MTSRHVSISQFAQVLKGLPDVFTEAAVRGLRSGAQRLKGFAVEEIISAKPHPAVAQGELKDSVVVFNVDDGAVVKVTAPHAAFIEEGTRPHFPPLQPIEDWVRAKGFHNTRPSGNIRSQVKKLGGKGASDAAVKRIAYAIALKISKEGIEPRHFFAKAVVRLEPIVPQEIAREMNKIGK